MGSTFRTKYKPDSQQLEQLELLKKIVEITMEANINISIIGGYGLDGLVGVLTRDHDDIDVLVSDYDRHTLVTILKQLGFQFHSEPPGKEVFSNDAFSKHFKIDVLHGVRLAEFMKIGAEQIFPKKPNAHISDLSFTVPTLVGNESIQEKQAQRAISEQWDSPYRHTAHRERLIGFLKQIET